MSTLEATVVQPRTIQVGIVTAAQTATYQLAPGLAQYVQAVYAEITNGAATDVQPLLTVSEQTGVVIAKKRQTGSIPAGESGSGTWALRLDDESTGTGGSGIQYDTDPQTGDWLIVDTTAAGPHGFGFESNNVSNVFIQSDSQVQLNGDVIYGQGGTIQWLNHSGEQWLANVGYFTVLTKNGEIDLQAADFAQLIASQTLLLQGARQVTITSTTRDTVVQLANTKKLIVKDHSGNAIFEVRDDGSLHGLTGQSLIFDL